MVAAIGSFPLSTQVMDVTLRGMGIGNVAVHPENRHQGHMMTALKMSVDDMIAQGMDFSCLGGQRQRYNYFSYAEVPGSHILLHPHSICAVPRSTEDMDTH